MSVLKNKVVSAAKWSFIESWSRRIIGFVVLAVLARNIGKESFGLVALATVYIALAETLSKQGLSMALIQRKELKPEHLSSAFLVNMCFAGALCIISIVAAPTIARLLGNEHISNIIAALSLTFPINALSLVPISLQTRELDFRSIAKQTFSASFTSGLTGIYMAINGYEAWALVGQTLSYSIVNSTVVIFRTKWLPTRNFTLSSIRDVTTFSFMVLISNLMTFAKSRTDQLFIGITLNASSLGVYTIAKRTTNTLISVINTPIERLIIPTFSRIQDDPEKLENAISKSIRICGLIFGPCLIGIAILSEEIIYIVVGPQWSEASPILSILAFTALTKSTYQYIYHVLMSQGKPGVIIWRQSTQAIAVIVACLLSKENNVQSIAINILLADLITFNIWSIATCKILKISNVKIFKSIISPLLPSAIMAAAVIPCTTFSRSNWDNPYITITLSATTGAAIFLIALNLFWRDYFNEAKEIATKLINRPNKKTK